MVIDRDWRRVPSGTSASLAALTITSRSRMALSSALASTDRQPRMVEVDSPSAAIAVSSVSTSRACSFLIGIRPSPAVIRLACLRTIALLVGSLILLGRWFTQSATTEPTVPATGPALPASASSRRSAFSLALVSVLVFADTLRRVRLRVPGSVTSSTPTHRSRSSS